MNNIESILENIRKDPYMRWRAVGNCQPIQLYCEKHLVECLSKDTFLGMAVLQDCNIGGEYWRHFVWFDNKDPDVEPDRLCSVGSWFLPNPPFKRLIEWTEGEIIEVPDVPNKKFVTKSVSGSEYFWILKPV